MYNIIKSIFVKKKNLSEVTIKQSVFFMSDSFENTPRPNWEIQMD